MVKTCSRCGETKTTSEFYRYKASPDGLNAACSSCTSRGSAELREYYKSRTDEEIEATATARGPRACRKCRVTKNPNEFPRDRGKRFGRGTMCLTCAAAATTHYRGLVDPEVFRQRRKAEFGRNREAYRGYKLRQNFGITLAEYRQMHAGQNGVCAICEMPETAVRGGRVIDLAVDHDHVTGAVRQLLCGACNKAVGYFRDSPELMRRAALYVENHKSLNERESPPA